MKLLCFGVVLIFTSVRANENNGSDWSFPDTFKFGAATASYQVEGGWNAGDKSESIWDYFTHNHPERMTDGSTGDVACDSYNQYSRDVQMLKMLGVDYYRFSLSWSRILPNGFANKISQDGLAYYNGLINELLENGIEPLVTMYHWDLPQRLQELGGWTNPLIVEIYAEYARVVFRAFGDRVKTWLTFNEPKEICKGGYGVDYAPALDQEGVADYICGHYVIKAHARAYHIYDEEFRPEQNGRISLTLSCMWFEPSQNITEDIEARDVAQQFEVGWFAHPIFTAEGDYPAAMKERIGNRSEEQGYPTSRLPAFSPEEVAYIRGTGDFFGLNHYSTYLAREPLGPLGNPSPSIGEDRGVDTYQSKEWPAGQSSWLKIVPWGLRKLLNWLGDNYDNPEIIICESGYSDLDRLNDTMRVFYYKSYLEVILEAIHEDDCNVTAYTAWSLMDNFEWLEGYTKNFGLFHVDFNSPNRTRTPKASAFVYKEIIRSRLVDWSYDPEVEEFPPEPEYNRASAYIQWSVLLNCFALMATALN